VVKINSIKKSLHKGTENKKMPEYQKKRLQKKYRRNALLKKSLPKNFDINDETTYPDLIPLQCKHCGRLYWLTKAEYIKARKADAVVGCTEKCRRALIKKVALIKAKEWVEKGEVQAGDKH